jgi:HD-like signal output (HDOD) protein
MSASANPGTGLVRELSDAVALPLMPPGVLHLLNALRAENLGTAQLTAEVRNFPPIVARVLALANSAWATPREPVTHLFGACALLGLDVVRSVCIALAIARPFNSARCPAFDAQRFWCSALLTGHAAAWLGPRLAPRSDPKTLDTAGLLHNLGLLAMAHAWPAATQQALEAAARGQELAAALRTATGSDHCEVGAAMGKAWKLPDELTTAMQHHARADYRGPHEAVVAAVGTGAALSAALLSEQGIDESDLRLAGLARSDAQSALEHLAKKRRLFTDLAKTLFER